MTKAQKKAISDKVKAALKSKGFSLKATAKHLGLKSPEQLRQWLSRKAMPEHHLRAVADLAGLSHQKLLREFTISAPPSSHFSDIQRVLQAKDRSIHEALRVMDRRVDEASDAYLETAIDVRFLVGSMCANDLVIYCSINRIPYEMEAGGLARSAPLFAEAVVRGAYFFYLYPEHEIVDAFRTQKISNLVNPEAFKDHYDRFCEAIARASDRPQPEAIRNHIRLYPCDDSAFMVPDFKFILFHPATSHEPQQMPPRLTASVPVGTPTLQMDLQLPMAGKITDQFQYFARNVLPVHDSDFPKDLAL